MEVMNLTNRILPISLLAMYLQSAGCWSVSGTQYYSSSTIQTGFTGDWWSLKPKAGPNEVFMFRQTNRIVFPPMVGHSYLFLEISSDLLVNGSTLTIPSHGVVAIVCQEVHPGFWCAPATGHVSLLRVLPGWVDTLITFRATSQTGFSKGQVKVVKEGARIRKSCEPIPRP